MITIKRTFCPGRGMIRPEELTGYVFSPEVAAHTFIITKMEKVDGQETAVPFAAGTDISCRFIKANGVTELVDGDLTDDGAASITLPAECYQVPGRFILSIYAETSEETICIYSATATALAGDTEEINVSGNTKRTIDAQIAALNDAVENAQETVEQVQEVIDSIPQDYTALSDSVSDLKSQIGGQTEIPVTGAGFYKCNKDTYYMDENLTSHASYKHAKIACNPGDVFVVSGTSPSNATAVRTYAFADENRYSLERSLVGETLENRMIIAPVGTAWLYITNYQNTATVIKGKPITMRVDDIKNTVSSYLFHSIDSVTFDVIWDVGGYNANSGQFNAGNTIRTNEGIDVQQTLLRRVYVTNKNFKLKLYAWNKTTQEYAGVWNGTEIVTYNESVPVEYAEINTSTLGGYLVRFVLLKTDGSAVSTSDASVVRFEVPWYEQVADESEQPQNYQGREICVFDKMVCIGDSIIHGGGDDPDVQTITPKRTVDDQDYSIPTLLHKMYGIETVNLGRSGATTESWYEFYTDAEHPERESLWSGYDAALIRIGNNDYNYCSAPPDGYSETPAEAAVRSKTNIKKIIDKLKTDNPGIRIFLCTLSKSNSYDTKAQYRIPLMEAIREIPNEPVNPNSENSPLYGESVFIVDTNQYSNYQSSGGYYYGHPTAIGYQAIAQDIGSLISYIIKTQNEKFKWVRWIGTAHAITDGVTPSGTPEDVG